MGVTVMVMCNRYWEYSPNVYWETVTELINFFKALAQNLIEKHVLTLFITIGMFVTVFNRHCGT